MKKDSMVRFSTKTRLGLCALVGFGSWTASAQSNGPQEGGQAQREEITEIVVTGTHIKRTADFETNSPTVTVTEDLFKENTSVGVESMLNQMPQFVPAGNEFATQGTQNSALNTTGISTVSLRGLGPNRTLLLIDGRRAMPSNAQIIVDTNTIPASAIQRVEVVTGGESAVYGADAVAGVVNFIMKDNFRGFQLDAQAGVTEEGDGAEWRFSPLFGASLDDGRGNVMLGISYDKRDPIYDRDRQWIRDDWANPSIGGNQNAWFTDPYLSFPLFDLNGDGIQPNEFNRPNQTGVDLLFTPGVIQAARTQTYTVASDGTVYTGMSGVIRNTNTGNTGSYRWPYAQAGVEYRDDVVFRKLAIDNSIRQNTIHQLLRSPLERTSMFARGHYDLTDNIRTIGQMSYTNSRTTTIFDYAPATQGSSILVPHGTDIYTASINNADYQQDGRFGLNCPATGCTNSEVFPLPDEVNTLLANRPAPNAPVQINKALDFAPPRTNTNSVQTFQVLYGLDGKIPSLDWTWDTSLSYGESSTTILNKDFVALTNYRTIAQSPNFGHGATVVGNTQGNGTQAGRRAARAVCRSSGRGQYLRTASTPSRRPQPPRRH